MADRSWFFASQGQQQGPYPEARLRQFIAAGAVTAETLVWTEGMANWLKAGDEAQMRPLLKTAMPHLLAVSINGADTQAEIQSGKGNWIQPLGSGSFDVYGLLRTLKELRYAGPVGLQCYGIPGDARVHLARSMEAWRALSERLRSSKG